MTVSGDQLILVTPKEEPLGNGHPKI